MITDFKIIYSQVTGKRELSIVNTINSENFTLSQLQLLKKFGSRINQLGANFAVCDVKDGVVLSAETDGYKSDTEYLMELSRQVLDSPGRAGSKDESPVWRFFDSGFVMAAKLRAQGMAGNPPETVGIMLIDFGKNYNCLNNAGIAYGQTNNIACGQIGSIADGQISNIADGQISNIVSGQIRNVACGQAGNMSSAQASSTVNISADVYFSSMLSMFAENFYAMAGTDRQIRLLGEELAKVYEELVLLHRLGGNMKLTESDVNFLQMACDNLTDVIGVEGIAILRKKMVDKQERLVIVAGSGLIDLDENMASVLHCRLSEQIVSGREALLDSDVDGPFKYQWPENVKSIIAVPLWGKEDDKWQFGSNPERVCGSIVGIMMAVNRIDRPDFDSTDAKLFNSVANSCAVFMENGRLFGNMKELFIGSLKALTSSIDAKDRYTRGHSERVAMVSKWIAEQMVEKGLVDQSRVHKIYLAGLLHDIGKIGIDDAILRKVGKLSPREWQSIKKHPVIGAGILRGIRQMKDIVTGVLYHHERIDGNGYPEGLQGDRIPLTGRIVCLADSFDAMISRRSYREALTLEQAMDEIKNGLGTQFDEQIGRIFLESDVYQLLQIIQGGWDNIYSDNGLNRYGVGVIGALIK